MDIAEFLTARLQDEVRVALGVGTDSNREVHWSSSRIGEVTAGGVVIARATTDDIAYFIELHDPARVLAEVAAKRAILAIHCTPASAAADDWRVSEHRRTGREANGCVGCGWGGMCDDLHVEDINRCPTLRALAQPFAEHPDYDPAWTLTVDAP